MSHFSRVIFVVFFRIIQLRQLITHCNFKVNVVLIFVTDWLGIDKLILLRKKRQTETCLFYGFVAAHEVIVSATRAPT